MRTALSVALTWLMLVRLVLAAVGADSVALQITAMPARARIEVRLKTKQTMRGTVGAVSSSGFTFVDASKSKHQIAFDDVAAVIKITKKPHLARNVLIGVGIGGAALVITVAVALRCGPLGCKNRGL